MPVNQFIKHVCSITKEQSGSAMLEIAIALPVFIFLFVAIVDFGLYFNKRNVAQSAAWNSAKECVKSGDPTIATTIAQATLRPILTDAELAQISTTCTPTSSGGANYQVAQFNVPGGMLSPLTSALGLYPIPAFGIAN